MIGLLRIIETFSKNQAIQIHELYQKEWWTSRRTFNQTLVVLERSQLCLGVVDDLDNIVGFSRVLTDFIFKALVLDVITQKDRRGQGIGQLLIETLVSHPMIRHVEHIELYCLPELETFYQQTGFSTNVGGIKLMRRSTRFDNQN